MSTENDVRDARISPLDANPRFCRLEAPTIA
jgi:hypothetical protein